MAEGKETEAVVQEVQATEKIAQQEEERDDYSDIRNMGYISLTPFIRNEGYYLILTEEVYNKYHDELEEDQFNAARIVPYNLTFYDISEEDGLCNLDPSQASSSSENEVSPLNWNQFASCARVGDNHFIVTGGVSLQSDYLNTFEVKFKMLLNQQSQIKRYKELVDTLKRLQNSSETTEQQQTENKKQLLPILNEANSLSKDSSVLKEGDPQKRIELASSIFQKQIKNFSLKAKEQNRELDRQYCKKQGIEFAAYEQTEVGSLVFNSNSPYSSQAIDITFEYDPENDEYKFTAKYLEQMPEARSNHQSLFHNGKLYVIGGVCQQKILKSVQVYDLATKTWSQFPSLLNPRVNFSAVSLGSHIYVFGGHTVSFDEQSYDYTLLERINPDTDSKWESFTWKKRLGQKSSIETHHQVQLFTFNKRLLLLGGFSSLKDQVQISEIEIKGDKWQISTLEGSNLAIRKNGSLTTSYYNNEPCYFVLGADGKILLECFKIEEKDNKLHFQKILDNDYSEQIYEQDPTFIPSSPSFYIS